MTCHVVERQDDLDLQFEGELLVDEHHHDIGFVKVFRTASGKWVLSQNLSARPGALLRRRVLVLDSAEEVGGELGFSSGAKSVRRKLRLPVRREI